MIQGKIVKQISNDYTVKVNNELIVCKARGKFRNLGITPLVGDNVILENNYILEILETDGKAFTRPWFGQLMVGPQLMAYLCQVNMWLEKYEPKIEL